MNQFYALLKDNQLRYIDLAEEIIESTKVVFVDAAEELMGEETEKIPFDGRYVIRDSEDEVSYVPLQLPDDFSNIPDNQQGITVLDVENDDIKSIFWYENGAFLFQMFSSANLLDSKYVVRYFQEEHTFNRMTEKAFIINNKVQAIHKDGNLYFKSFPSASKIFDLKANMVEATTVNSEIKTMWR